MFPLVKQFYPLYLAVRPDLVVYGICVVSFGDRLDFTLLKLQTTPLICETEPFWSMITKLLRSQSDCRLFGEGKVEHINGPTYPNGFANANAKVKGAKRGGYL